ncbi:MAG: riboflavin synthase [Bacteroidota bacterium]|nr:riboflavin synthase [Bacteroidota bacterium]
MFTGIIEGMGKVVSLDPEDNNLHITVECPFAGELKVDQSVAHNGVCLTVVAVNDSYYKVTAISETLRKSNLGLLKSGELINLERSMILHGRIDGHIVQGHVDVTGVCTGVENQHGSWLYRFEYDPGEDVITVPKGSICVNGVSLTVVDSGITTFSVAIIPFTYDHTNFKNITMGSVVNLEFDVIGKYVAKYLALKEK